MMIVGLTGGIGSGKSTVARLLRGLGAPIVDSDQLARAAVAPGEPALAEIVQAFGPAVLGGDGALDRGALARVVFADAEARRRLEAILHPRIATLRDERLASLRASGVPACVVDVPLLYEAGLDASGLCDEVWVVWATPETQSRRVMARDAISHEEVHARLAAQWPLREKVRRADVVIDNEGDLEATAAAVREAWAAVLRRAGSA